MIEGSFDTGQECTEAVTVRYTEWYPVRAGEIPPDGDTFTKLILHRTVVTAYTTSCNAQNSYILPTRFIYVFCVDLRTNSDYFPIQH